VIVATIWPNHNIMSHENQPLPGHSVLHFAVAWGNTKTLCTP